MLEQLQQIDTSVIDELMEIKQERETISDRLAKMVEDQGKVSDVVYRRVRRDYESKISALERKAAPLKERARQEYAKLKSLLDRIQSSHQATQLDREEIDFRHKLGEYPEEDFDTKVGELDAKLDEQKSQLEDAEGVKEQFVAAFDSEEDLAATTTPPAPAPAPTPEPNITTPQPVAPAPGATAAIPATPPDEEPVSAPIPLPPLAEEKNAGEGTVILAEEAPPPPPGEAPQPAADAPSPAETKEVSPSTTSPAGKTVVLVKGKLIAIDTDLGATEFPLEPLTFIGRTPENQIRLNKPAVSRRHAQIAQSESGYVLRDLNSENGSYVNGERVKERPLADGDRVQIGTVRFVFRAG